MNFFDMDKQLFEMSKDSFKEINEGLQELEDRRVCPHKDVEFDMDSDGQVSAFCHDCLKDITWELSEDTIEQDAEWRLMLQIDDEMGK